VEPFFAPHTLHPAKGCKGRAESFPMIGKKVSNGWKKCPGFSNDWKNYSAIFQ
jgi:hypothetical protein